MRTVSWFSCGAASAVATKLAIASGEPITVVYCEVIEEHPDNKRFLKDCEKWFGQEIIILGNDKYNRSIYEVFKRRRYISGVAGAPCTGLLKKEIREKFQEYDDVHVFGYTSEEENRLNRFIDANNDVDIIAPLIDRGLTKQDCLAMIENAGIELPAMYKLGFKNNNCRGCCKSSSPAYWLLIKQHFPDMFKKMADQEAVLNVNLIKYTDKKGELQRCKLTEIPDWYKPMDDTVDIQCGIFCLMAENEIN